MRFEPEMDYKDENWEIKVEPELDQADASADVWFKPEIVLSAEVGVWTQASILEDVSMSKFIENKTSLYIIFSFVIITRQ